MAVDLILKQNYLTGCMKEAFLDNCDHSDAKTISKKDKLTTRGAAEQPPGDWKTKIDSTQPLQNTLLLSLLILPVCRFTVK